MLILFTIALIKHEVALPALFSQLHSFVDRDSINIVLQYVYSACLNEKLASL